MSWFLKLWLSITLSNQNFTLIFSSPTRAALHGIVLRVPEAPRIALPVCQTSQRSVGLHHHTGYL